MLGLMLAALLSGCGFSGSGVGPVETKAPEASQPPPSAAPTAMATPVESRPAETPAPESAPVSPAATPEPTAETAPPSTPEPTPEAERPTDEEVIAAYRRAEEAYGWFDLAPLPVDGTDQQRVGELVYSRVDYGTFHTLADLRGYLKGLFSDALVSRLLPPSGTQYIDLDGALYGLDGGRGADLTKGEDAVQVLWDEGRSRCTVEVTVEVLDPEQDYAVTGYETYAFPYEQVGDQWIFTSFSLVR